MMGKPDFEVIAKVIKARRSWDFTSMTSYHNFVRAMTNKLKSEYPHFDTFKFQLQCGLEDFKAEQEKER